MIDAHFLQLDYHIFNEIHNNINSFKILQGRLSNTIANYVTTGRLNSIVNAHIYPKGQELKFDYSYPLNILSIFDCTLSLQEVFTNAFLHQK
jgi:hypothetical protein